MRKLLLALGLTLGVLAGGLAFVYSGAFDVAATTPHWAVTRWALSTVMLRSVRSHARGIETPPGFDEVERARAGARDYAAMCAECHGAPGREPGEVGRGLEPRPPRLEREVAGWSAAEVFWVTRNGVRMTGMPAFGPTHSDEELWAVTAFVKRLPELSPAEYLALAPEAREHEHHHGHRHAH